MSSKSKSVKQRVATCVSMDKMTAPDKEKIHGSLCGALHKLYQRKNADYGDSFSQLRKRYPNFVCMRLFDKLNRLDNIITPGRVIQVSEETIEDTLLDIANYCIMELTERIAEHPGAIEETWVAELEE